MNRLATVGALAFVALTAPAAQAHHAWQPMPGNPSAQVSGDATDPLIGEYVAAAQAFWGAAPTCDGSVAFHFVLYTDSSDVATARASQCTGWLNGRDWWPNAPRSEGWCAAIAHEVGHGLHGPGHSPDPANVMYSATDSGGRWAWEGSVPGCARFGPAASTEPAPALHLRATGSTRRCRALRDRVDFAFRRTVRLRLAAKWRRSCRAVGVCALADGRCYGPLEAHHWIGKRHLRHDERAYADPRNGAALCAYHHAQVEHHRVECPRPPALDGFLEDFNLTERGNQAKEAA